MRTGVPVFIRCDVIPRALMLSVRCSAAGSAQRPPGTILRPMCISPLRKVPAVITTAGAYISQPQMVFTPTTRWLESEEFELPSLEELTAWDSSLFTFNSSLISSSTWSCQMSRLGVLSSMVRHCQMNFPRSHCARGLHMAGPFDLLSILNCIAVMSVTVPMPPPRASTSRTICPLAMPPTAGLHDICAILFISMVTRHVLAPIIAAA